jgi:hypothetical protein
MKIELATLQQKSGHKIQYLEDTIQKLKSQIESLKVNLTS